MSSSTKMNGAAIPRTSQSRSSHESPTIPASHAHAGTRTSRSVTEVDLGEPPRDLRGLGRSGGDADRARRLAHLAENRVRDRGAARDTLERGRLARRDSREV